jgi:hypothetical protein
VRPALIVIGVLAVVLASCAKIPTPQEANDAVLALRKYQSWTWAVGIALIWADLVLPIPQTAVIAALGDIYGTLRPLPRPLPRATLQGSLSTRSSQASSQPCNTGLMSSTGVPSTASRG